MSLKKLWLQDMKFRSTWFSHNSKAHTGNKESSLSCSPRIEDRACMSMKIDQVSDSVPQSP